MLSIPPQFTCLNKMKLEISNKNASTTKISDIIPETWRLIL